MMKRLSILFTTILIWNLATGQDTKFTFGQLNQNDLNPSVYEKDSSASAVVLFDLGKTNFPSYSGGLEVLFTHTKRIKILDKSALDQANITIGYYVDGYGRTEQVKGIKAKCYNREDGMIHEIDLDKKDIYDEKITDVWHTKKFAIPGAKVGSIIEYTYMLQSPFHWNLQPWEFQSEIPTIYSQYTLKMVPFYEYIILSQGIDNPTFEKSYISKGLKRRYGSVSFSEMIYEYTLEDVPAFTDDEFITAPEDYIKKIEFQLAKVTQTTGTQTEHITTWEDLVEEFIKEESFGKYIKASEKISVKEITPLLNLEGLPKKEVIKTVTNYVKKEFRWDNYYGKYAVQKPKQLMQGKTGRASDINLFLIGLMRAAGIEADPVLISTRSHGKIFPDYPITGKFNYVIIKANLEGDDFMLIDATEPLLPYYLLPTRSFNDIGLILDENQHSWIKMEPIVTSNKIERCVFKISHDTLNISVTQISNGYDAWRARKSYMKDSKEYEALQIRENEEITSDFKIINDKKYSANLIMSYHKRRYADSFEGKRYFVPFDKVEYAKNPLRKLKRDYPVDMVYTKSRILSTSIVLDESSVFTHIPEDKTFDDDLMSLNYKVSQFDTFIKIDVNYEFKKNIYPPEDYDRLKKDFEILYQKLNEQVVIGSNE